MDYIWYFAYGSNLNKKQVIERINDYKKSKPAILKDYKLTFNIYSDARNGGVADIIKSENDKVYGAIYLIPKKDYEKVEKTGLMSGRYKKKEVNVLVNEEIISAKTFEVVNKNDFIKPSESYLNTIIEGLKDHGYNNEVIRKVKHIANKE